MDALKKRKLEDNGVVLPDLTIEDARKILEPLNHEQLFEIVQNALLRHPDVLDAVRSIADRDPTQRKLFIRGLGWETTTEKLRALFSQYGDLDEAVVILDKATGKSKGYGFVTFKHIDGSLRALKQPSKQIDGRMAVTQLAAAGISGGGPGGGGPGGNSVDVSMRKIYVGNVPYGMPGQRLLQHFSMYGEIEEGPLGFDKATGKSKGFALFVYKTAEAAKASLVDPVKNIDGHQLNCKLANDGKKGKPGGPGDIQGGGNPQGNGVGPAMPLGGQYGGHGGVGGMSSYTGYSGVNPAGGNQLNLSLGSGGGAAAGVGVGTTTSTLGSSGGFGSGLGGPYGGGSQFGGPTGYGGLTGIGGGLGSSGGFGGGLGGASGGLSGAGGLGGPGSGLAGGGGALGGAGSGLAGAGGGLGGAGSALSGAGGGLSGSGSGFGGSGRGSSLYGVAPGSGGMPSGEYPQSAHYSLSSSSAYPNQHQHQPATGASTAPRVPLGGFHQGMPPYY